MIRVVNPKVVLNAIKNEVFLDPMNLTLIYIKEQYEQVAKLSGSFGEDKLKIVHGSEADFYELLNNYQDNTLDQVCLIFTIDEFESLENLFILINKKIRKGGQIIISHVQLNTSIYDGKHFFDQNIPESIPMKLVKKRYKKNLTKIAYFQYFGIEAPFILNKRYSFYLLMLFSKKYKIKKFIETDFILKLFYNNDYIIIKDDRYLGLIKFQKNY